MEESILGICVKPNIFNSILIWGGAYFSDVNIKPNIFNSILIFMPNILGVKTNIYGMCIKPKIVNYIPRFVPNICGEETYF